MVEITKKQIITIAGRPGSGKSTTSRAVATMLGYEHFSSGDLFRAIAREHGLELYELNRLAEEEKSLDYLVDEKLKKIGETQDEVAIDSRLAWHWIPQSFKVFLDLDLDIAAQRIISNLDPERLENEHIPNDPKEYAEMLKKRLESESKRYMDLYQADPYNLSNYNLVINTANSNPDQVVDELIGAYKSWLAS